MVKIRKEVFDLSAYTVDQTFTVAKLNQNECPYDIDEKLKDKIFQKVKNVPWNRYPDSECTRLKECLSDYADHSAEGIVLGNSSNEIIRMVYSACCRSDDKVVISQPGYVVFKRTCQIMGLEAVEVSLKNDFSYNVEKIIKSAMGAKLVILSSPNNPTGIWLSMKEIEQIASCIDCIFALDEAYFEFSDQDASTLLHKYKNLVVIRTFSKALSLAGIRLGYLLGHPDIVFQMSKTKMPFSVGWFPQIAGEVVLENRDFVRVNTDRIIKERSRMFSELERMDYVKPFPSKTNFIMFQLLKHSTLEIEEKLRNAGILIRKFSGKLVEDKLRVTIGLPHENDAFLETLSKLLGITSKV